MKFEIHKTSELPKDEFTDALKALKPGESFVPLGADAKPWGWWDFAKMQLLVRFLGLCMGKNLKAERHNGGVRIDCF